MTWHIDIETVRSYEAGGLTRPAAASLEAHITSCPQCGALFSVDEAWLERSWTGIADRVEPTLSRLESALRLVGVPEVSARLVVKSPAMRLSFVLALLLVLGFAVIASNTNPVGTSYRFFLVVAPLVPVAGVAFAYGRLVDPAHELTRVSPTSSFRLLLIRSATVVSVAILGALIAWPFVPAPSSVGVSAWLLPALTLTLTTLALASRFETWLAAAMVGGGWALVMTFAVTRDIEAFGAGAQLVHLLLAVTAGTLVVVRRDAYNRQGGGR